MLMLFFAFIVVVPGLLGKSLRNMRMESDWAPVIQSGRLVNPSMALPWKSETTIFPPSMFRDIFPPSLFHGWPWTGNGGKWYKLVQANVSIMKISKNNCNVLL
jgi:hypothetical protein